MERLKNSDFILDIEMIDRIEGGNQEFDVFFTACNGRKYKIQFSPVWDMRYSIENGYINRFYHLRKHQANDLKFSSIYLIHDSEYIKYFKKQVSGTRPIDEIENYIISDRVDTVIEFLTIRKPILVEL